VYWTGKVEMALRIMTRTVTALKLRVCRSFLFFVKYY
jgi:hypothetical protein